MLVGKYRWAIKRFSFFLLLFLLFGCATTGPKVSKKEIEELKKELKAKAFLRNVRASIRLMDVGVGILKNLPEEDIGKERSMYTGIVFSELTSTSRKAFGINKEEEKGVLVAGVVKDSPADKAEIEPGDIIKRVNGREIDTIDSFSSALKVLNKAKRFIPIPYTPRRRMVPKEIEKGKGVPLILDIQRGGNAVKLELLPELIPTDIDFVPVQSAEINAFATPSHRIGVTYGMLRFVESDDELAVVLGHEVAHITRKHIVKSIPSQILAVILGALAQEVIAGAGDITSQAVRAPFSREFEREADYFGLLYAHRAGYDIQRGAEFWERFAIELPQSLSRSYLNTHPSSPERLIRLMKLVEELQKSKE